MREPEQNSADEVPKLLTEAEWRALKHERLMDRFLTELRARNLIAPEPVDPLLIEAREICAKYWGGQGDYRGADAYREGCKDDWASAQIALAALRRGMELARGVTMEKNNG